MIDLPFEPMSESKREQVAELDRRWAKIEAGEPTVENDEVVRWLKTWGTPAHNSWSAKQSSARQPNG